MMTTNNINEGDMKPEAKKQQDGPSKCRPSQQENRYVEKPDEYGLGLRESLALQTQLHSGSDQKSFRNPLQRLKEMQAKKNSKEKATVSDKVGMGDVAEEDIAEEDIVEEDTKGQLRVAVFNANSVEGSSVVRGLAKNENCFVVAIVRVITSRNVRPLLTMDNVRVLIADSHHDMSTLGEALEGCSRAFFVTKYWEKFDGAMEETQVRTVLDACANAKVYDVVFSCFEDTRKLREKNEKSQIQQRESTGKLDPKFEGMRTLLKYGKKKKITVTHMITSYLDQENSKKSICVIRRGTSGKVIVETHLDD